MTMFSDGMLMAGGGAQGPVFIAASDDRQTNTVNLAVPTGTADGDLMIAFVSSNVAGGSTATPSGWTKILTNVANSLTLEVFTKVASGEPASYAFTKSGSSTVVGLMATYRGGAGLVDLIGSYTYSASSTDSTGASITPTHTGTLLGFFSIRRNSIAIVTSPAGMTTRKYTGTATIDAILYDLSPSGVGATGAKTLTWAESWPTGGVLIQIH